MSASLVGSEMCIRDRCVHGRTRLASTTPSRCGPSRSRPGRRPSRSWGSVSYTHLTLPTICSV
eukprot:2868436-Alexandrium_andersonii.AAC.1